MNFLSKMKQSMKILQWISTNVTSFFREPRQWEFLKKRLIYLEAKNGGKLRIWSSASSTGEEPYTIGQF